MPSMVALQEATPGHVTLPEATIPPMPTSSMVTLQGATLGHITLPEATTDPSSTVEGISTSALQDTTLQGVINTSTSTIPTEDPPEAREVIHVSTTDASKYYACSYSIPR